MLQESGKDIWQPLESSSRKMTDTEKRSSMEEKETLVIMWAVWLVY